MKKIKDYTQSSWTTIRRELFIRLVLIGLVVIVNIVVKRIFL